MVSAAALALSSLPIAAALHYSVKDATHVARRAFEFPRDGVMIPDSEMPAFTHLNEFHDVCVEPAQAREDLHTLLLLNATEEDMRQPLCREESFEPTWNGDGKNCGMTFFRPGFARREQVSDWQWIKEPTAALAFYSTNPGHFVSDVLWSLLPRFHEADPFSQTWLVDDRSCKHWFCDTLQAYYKVKNGKDMRIMRHPGRACFKTLYVPQTARWRWQPDEVKNLEVHTLLRTALTAGLPAPRDNVLLYDHTDGNGRQWRNAADFEGLLTKKGHSVNRISSFRNLTQKQQCNAFYDAKVIITSHGGHMGNLLCVREGTRVVEMACNPEEGWFTTAYRYQSTMGFKDRWQQVPPEFCLHENEVQFYDSFIWPVKDMYNKLFKGELADALERGKHLRLRGGDVADQGELADALERVKHTRLREGDVAAVGKLLA